MTYAVVTTCNADGWNKYGRSMVESFRKFWPSDIKLFLYNEGFKSPDGVVSCEFPEWHQEFKKRHLDNPAAHGLDASVNRRGRRYDYRYDCVRFSHKVAAITDIGLAIGEELDLLWIDADTITHSPVTHEWLDSVLKRDSYMAWLSRARKYPECGFVAFNTAMSEQHGLFMSMLENTYQDDVVLDHKETHDSYMIEQISNAVCGHARFDHPMCLSGDRGRLSMHPFVKSRLAEKMDHLKGNFKSIGRTPRSEAPERFEKYWN